MREQYLVSVDLTCIPQLSADLVVVGSGVAGLMAALAAAGEGARVIVVTKDRAEESNSYHAQGGVAVALADEDDPEDHLVDTLASGCGLCDETAVRVLVTEGVERCRQLIEWGTPFDRAAGRIAFTMEGAHGCRRVIHAAGDATGKTLEEALLARVRATPGISVLEEHFVVELLHHEGECYGLLALESRFGSMLKLQARAVVVASGGLGQIYRETTNPAVATADGYALCLRAGALLRDMEFVQFHPTTLYLAGATRFLISESVRGEGAYLVNQHGERFMGKYSDKLELAPRDVVSQAIFREIHATGGTHVNLDLRHLPRELVKRRFPTITALCDDYGLDLSRDLIPVKPAVHYMMGGVATDLYGATRVRRLYAAGEVASTGVHGANRLASNSLLEGLVFGWRAGLHAVSLDPERARPFPRRTLERSFAGKALRLDLEDMLRSLKSLSWRCLGVFREPALLDEAAGSIRQWERYVLAGQFSARAGFEVQNMLSVAKAITHAAMGRTESRGAHQRTDFPATDPAWRRHQEFDLEALDG